MVRQDKRGRFFLHTRKPSVAWKAGPVQGTAGALCSWVALATDAGCCRPGGPTARGSSPDVGAKPPACRCAGLARQPPPRRRSPLWDQEDFYQREGCAAVNVVSMPFYWPPRPGALWEGAPLPVPQSAAFHPTFGAMTVAGSQPLTMG